MKISQVGISQAALLVLALAVSGAALAQSAAAYPVKPVRVVDPYPPGGQADTLMRAIGRKLTERWNHPVLTDNRPGAGGNIGAELVAKAAPDGYTLIVASGTLFTVNPALYKNVTWDPLKDFAPITRLSAYSSMLVVHPSVPVKNVPEFIALVKAKPGALSYGSFGIGTAGHLHMEAFKLDYGLDIVPIHYKGSAPAQLDLTAGRLAAAFFSVFSTAQHVRAGKWKVLGYAQPRRHPNLPDAPTFTEQGVPFEASSWFCLMAPGGTPRAITGRIQQDIARAMKEPDLAEWFAKNGLEPVGDTPEELAALIKSDVAKWGRIVKASGATLD
jgi:tripartite-type tricarboxylate transporter receptor subunit TctC